VRIQLDELDASPPRRPHRYASYERRPACCRPALWLFMKILVVLLVLLVVAASLLADAMWRKWIASRRRDRQ